MRTAYRIFAILSLVAAVFLTCITIVFWSTLQSNQSDIIIVFESTLKSIPGDTTFATLNWPFLSKSLLICALILIFGGVGVFTCGTDKDVWKSQKELFELREQLHRERMEVLEIRDKLTRALLKHE